MHCTRTCVEMRVPVIDNCMCLLTKHFFPFPPFFSSHSISFLFYTKLERRPSSPVAINKMCITKECIVGTFEFELLSHGCASLCASTGLSTLHSCRGPTYICIHVRKTRLWIMKTCRGDDVRAFLHGNSTRAGVFQQQGSPGLPSRADYQCLGVCVAPHQRSRR